MAQCTVPPEPSRSSHIRRASRRCVRAAMGAGGASPAVLDGLQLVKLVTIQAVSRGSAARRSHRKRSQVAQELLLTERSYYQGLRTLIDVYLSPLTQLSTAGPAAEIPAAQRRGWGTLILDIL